jgi:hypothetical protein
MRALVISLVIATSLTALAQPALATVSTVPDVTWMTNGTVYAVVRLGDVIYLGGSFTELRAKPSGGAVIPVKNLAAIDARTGQGIASWTPDAVQPNRAGAVFTLAVAPDGSRIYAGGDFTSVDGVDAKRVVALDPITGAVDRTFTVNVDWKVRTILPAGDRVYLGGDFDAVNGVARSRLAAVDLSGALDQAFAPTVSGANTAWNGRVTSLALSADGNRLFVVGDYRVLSGCSRRSIGAVNAVSGACDSGFAPSVESTTQHGGQHIFQVIATTTRVYVAMGGYYNYIAAYDQATGQRRLRIDADGDPQAMALVGSQMYIGGHFDRIGGYTRKRLALLDLSTGKIDSAWAPTTNSYYGVWVTTAYASELYIGGEFTYVSGKAQRYFARFSTPDTGPPTTPTGLSATVTSSEVSLTWSASADDTGVAGYEIRRDGVSIATTGPETSFTDSSVSPARTYTYDVRAKDAVGNWSGWSSPLQVTTLAGPLFADGFETGDLSRWTGSSSQMAVGTDVVYAGSFAGRATSSGPVTFAYRQLATDVPEVRFSFHFSLLSKGANKVGIGRVATGSGGGIATLLVTQGGNLGWRNNVTGTADVGSSVPVTPGWHGVEFRVLVAGTNSEIEVWLDGSRIDALSATVDLGTAGIGRIYLGEVAGQRTYDVAFDEVSVS